MVVLSMPLLDTRGRSEDDPTGEMISKIVLTVLAWAAQKETEERKRRQRGGIDGESLLVWMHTSLRGYWPKYGRVIVHISMQWIN